MIIYFPIFKKSLVKFEKRGFWLICSIIFLFWTFLSFLYADTAPTYRLINANTLFVSKLGDEYITNLQGDVHFFYDDIEFFADQAEIYEKRQTLTLMGSVKAIQDTLNLECSLAHYFHETQYLRLTGNVVMTETMQNDEIRRRTTANSGNYFRDKGEIDLTGNVFAHSIPDSLFAKSGYAFYNQKTGYGYLIQNPLIWRTGNDSLSLYAEKIEFFEPIKKVVASFDVITQNQNIKATCDFLIYYEEEGRIVYIGNPKFFSEEGDGFADLITIMLDNENEEHEGVVIKEIILQDNCSINFRTSENMEKDSWITGDSMTLFYANNKPSEFIAEDNVNSRFNHRGEKNQQEMSNTVSGKYLKINFDENSNATEIKINETVRGVYRFQRSRR